MILGSDLITEIRRIAEDNPSMSYNFDSDSCQYYPTPKNPYGCIIGYAMRNLGSSLDNFISQNVKHLTYEGPDKRIQADAKQTKWLSYVQLYQDCGKTWSEAVNFADEKFPLEGK